MRTVYTLNVVVEVHGETVYCLVAPSQIMLVTLCFLFVCFLNKSRL